MAPEFSNGDTDLITAVHDHIDKYFGGDYFVLDEKQSPLVHVDVYVVRANGQRNYHVLFTSGMSEKPMNVPEDCHEWKYAELMLCLPQSWPLTSSAFDDERNWWPIRALKDAARYAHENST